MAELVTAGQEQDQEEPGWGWVREREVLVQDPEWAGFQALALDLAAALLEVARAPAPEDRLLHLLPPEVVYLLNYRPWRDRLLAEEEAEKAAFLTEYRQEIEARAAAAGTAF